MAHAASITFLALVLSVVAIAQQPSETAAFEVATIRANTSGPGPAGALMLLAGGRVVAQNMPMRELIRAAYALEDSQLEGGQPWMRSERFDVEARAGRDITIEIARALVRRLLAERFGLIAHTESRQLPIYELVRVRSDRPIGRNLRPSGADCAPVTLPTGIPPAPPPPAGGGTPIGIGGFQCPTGLLPGHLSLRNIEMTAFAGLLWRRVIQLNGRPASDNPSLPAQIAGAPSIFTAVQEQLGLRLASARGAVDVLVIDRIDRPTEN
jgi:uncharacterized protein (TIGR03435 family)